ncbi:MAG: tetratricopeptide repeat protein, partial [Myxococcota bacterium]
MTLRPNTSLAWLCALACVLAAPLLHAHPDVDAAKEAFARGEFRQALSKLERAERSPSKTEEDVVDMYWYRGASFHALGRTDDANRAFDALLELRPLYQPDKYESSPDLRAAFQSRATLYQQQKGVMLGPPSLDGATLSVPIIARAEKVSSVVVFVRTSGSVTYQSFTLPLVERGAQGVVGNRDFWQQAARVGSLDLVLEARNPGGVPLARAGDAVRPLEFKLTPAQLNAALNAVSAAPVDATPPLQTAAPVPTAPAASPAPA